MGQRLAYFFRESLRGFLANRFMTFVVVSNIALSLFFIGAFFIAFLNLNRLIESAEEKIQLEVFLEDKAAGTEVLKKEILATEGVVEAEYISKKEAYEVFQRDVGKEILTAVEGNPLPASFRVKIAPAWRTPDRVAAVRKALQGIPFVEDVSEVKDWVPKLEKVRNIFISVSLVVILVLCVAIFFMVASAIRVTFQTRHELVRVMELVGATENEIKIPFLIEGALKGLLGGLLSYVLLAFVMFLLHKILPEITLYRRVFAVQVFMGFFLGLIASVKSVNVAENH
ncbi:MAG: permease-like cell division protein FtsX [Fibrobacterota bacterium]